jgi:UDP-N-acetylglucosamine:LPS N-acetylglucosamine transferase
MFGGHGSAAMQSIARQLDDIQLILVCGHNRKLAANLREMSFTAPRLIVEFSPEIRYYMQLSDFFIGKPGPGSLSEATQQRLPVIVARNSWTMPQERYNTQWVRENQFGLVVPSFRAIRSAVQDLSERLGEFRAHLRTVNNYAVFEIPRILDQILDAPALEMPLPRPGRVTPRAHVVHAPAHRTPAAPRAAWRQGQSFLDRD